MYSLTLEELKAITEQLPDSEINDSIKEKLKIEIDYLQEIEAPKIAREMLRIQLAQRMFECCEKNFNTTKQQLIGTSREQQLCDMRHAFLVIMIEKGIGLNAAAKTINRGHCLSVYARKTHDFLFRTCNEYATIYTELKKATEYGN